MAKRPISQSLYFFCVIPPCGEEIRLLINPEIFWSYLCQDKL